MKASAVAWALVAIGCGSSLQDRVKVNDPKASSTTHGLGSETVAVNSTRHRIQCVASKYKDNSWFELGRFESGEPGVAEGEESQSAEMTVGNIGFSAAGNLEEGFISFASIYDRENRVGSQLQLGKNGAINLYLLEGAYSSAIQYNLSCSIVED